ncbi:hypothetical protein CLAFUW4_13429 [Fulvia fulva]|uniref:Uncharacterized protein n=1 Tax=Passalora fulva TaxID=5499 RepID=A0A9Q8PJ33_PASFU|nr:uncharacterized protein CLAFUR5_13283 [Fulvia fulva]KAK4611880.1 hypothetical protein CLAFUR4_13432 [Fulvia fulva]KAK4613159.1 hypothetical protein CLAFUR0_13440 [Fulvia fulva]UJO23430.1 hypothetical protein CLAFUR5_13283 [Fulvia fulva]WPV21627.1 hypothetical protein CLAFUW4_13429 [Fulvia fulva]WPV36265.1 hypothetical protein CLAFUW7_13436 [Fulvia fulva]
MIPPRDAVLLEHPCINSKLQLHFTHIAATMGQPSQPASNALLYCTYAAFLVFGLAIAYRLRGQSKTEWLSANRTQKAIPLALNFIASGECRIKAPKPI